MRIINVIVNNFYLCERTGRTLSKQRQRSVIIAARAPLPSLPTRNPDVRRFPLPRFRRLLPPPRLQARRFRRFFFFPPAVGVNDIKRSLVRSIGTCQSNNSCRVLAFVRRTENSISPSVIRFDFSLYFETSQDFRGGLPSDFFFSFLLLSPFFCLKYSLGFPRDF